MAIWYSLEKKCHVCGDKALAFNFNGLSCEPCKAFFRRNALRQKELSCLRGGYCKICILTRKFCPRCRLDKCFSIGMKKELVMARDEKWEKIKNRIKSKENVSQNVLHDAIHLSPSSHLEDENQSFDFGSCEQERFDEMKQASLVFLHKPYCALKLPGETNLSHASNQQEAYIKEMIEFCKSINAFHSLKQVDQMILVRGLFTDSMTIRCAYHYDVEEDRFPINVILLKEDELVQSALFVRLDTIFPSDKRKNLNVYRKYIYLLHYEIENDKNIQNLLITIAIFRPKGNISCPEFIRYHYFVYCRLFMRYLKRKYRDEKKADKKYCKLMHLMDQMCYIRELIYDTNMTIDTGLVSRVLEQIYHLNSVKIVN